MMDSIGTEPRATTLEAEMQEFLRRLDQEEGLTPEEVEAAVSAFEARFESLRAQVELQRLEEEKEKGLGKQLRDLEAKTRRIRQEAKELEATELRAKAHELLVRAEQLERALGNLSREMLHQRQQGLPALREQARKLEEEFQGLDRDYNALLAALNKKEQEAQLEDRIDSKVRLALLYWRAGLYYAKEARKECEFLSRRGALFEKAQAMMVSISEDSEFYRSNGMTREWSAQFTREVSSTKADVRGHLQDLHHLVSEGLKEKDLDGKELALPFAMTQCWERGDAEGFYRRAWALHFLVMNGDEVDPKLKERVRSLMQLVNGPTPPGKEQERQYAAEARRFLVMAGNGVIRTLLEENYNGLKRDEDYARLGQALHDPRPPSWLYLVKVAVNLPRLYDLSLNDRFESLYETRLKQSPTRQVSPHPVVRLAEEWDDLQDVPPEELTRLWEQRLMDGDLPMVTYEEQQWDEVEVGRERTVEAQEYLLDVSASMINQGSGRRYWLRNAIFIAALNSFSVDARTKGLTNFENLLFFRTFGEVIGPLQVVRSQAEALAYLKTFLDHTGVEGDTLLQEALMTAYGDIAEAKGAERALKDAKVVVVTDGGAGLDLQALLAAQQVEGTAIVTHVMAVEHENPELRELSRQSGPGKAFYHFIQNAGDPALMATPPYGKKDEFPALWNPPAFRTREEAERFNASVRQLSRDTTTDFKRARGKREDQASTRAREWGGLFMRGGMMPGQAAYEDVPNPTERNLRERKMFRMRDQLAFLQILIQKRGHELNEAEAMELLRQLAMERAVLPRDLKPLMTTSAEPRWVDRYRQFIQDCLPKIQSVE